MLCAGDGVTAGRQRCHCGSSEVSLWVIRGVTVGRQRCHCGWSEVSLWVVRGVTAGRQRCHCGLSEVSMWVVRGVTVGRQRCHCGSSEVSLWVVRQKEASEGRGGTPVMHGMLIRLHPGPVPSSHVDHCLTRPVVIVEINVGPAYGPALHHDFRMSEMFGVRPSVEVEDVDTRHRGSEVPGGGVEAAPLVVQDAVKPHVGRRTQRLAPACHGVEGHHWGGHVCTWTWTRITGLCQW